MPFGVELSLLLEQIPFGAQGGYEDDSRNVSLGSFHLVHCTAGVVNEIPKHGVKAIQDVMVLVAWLDPNCHGATRHGAPAGRDPAADNDVRMPPSFHTRDRNSWCSGFWAKRRSWKTARPFSSGHLDMSNTAPRSCWAIRQSSERDVVY